MRSVLNLASVLGVLAGLIGGAAVSCALADVTISIEPPITYAAIGETITVDIWKDLPDTTFDGYETIITWNPSELQYISAAEESVMTKSCGSRWWYLTPGSGTLFISHVRMCPPLTLVTGPGALSSLTFKVLAEGRIVISKNYFWFTKEGYWIKNTIWEDGLVLVGNAGVGSSTNLDPGATLVKVTPNPGAEFSISVSASPGQLEIYDVAGRVVRTLEGMAAPGAPDVLTWDGKDALGRTCPPGMYFAGLKGGAPSGMCPIVLVR